jgi:hypothetical protein
MATIVTRDVDKVHVAPMSKKTYKILRNNLKSSGPVHPDEFNYHVRELSLQSGGQLMVLNKLRLNNVSIPI